MKIKWYCKYCAASGEIDPPVTMQEAARQMTEAHTKKYCPALASGYSFVVADLQKDDLLCADGSIVRTPPNQQIVLFMQAIQ